MNRKTKRFIRKLLLAYAALATIVVLVALKTIPTGMFSMIAQELCLLSVNVCSCDWVMDKAMTVSGIPKKEAYAYYTSLLGRKGKFRRRYWYKWVSERTDNLEEFVHWDRLANYSIAPAALYPVICTISTYPGLAWLPNVMLFAIACYCLIMAYLGVRYLSEMKDRE